MRWIQAVLLSLQSFFILSLLFFIFVISTPFVEHKTAVACMNLMIKHESNEAEWMEECIQEVEDRTTDQAIAFCWKVQSQTKKDIPIFEQLKRKYE